MLEYNDDSMLGYGKHKFLRLKDIPAEYFINIYDNGGGCSDDRLKQYIEKNIENIRARVGLVMPMKNYIPFICNKKTFATEKDARRSLKTIRGVKPKSDKKPLRVYECPKCSGWHLTSKSLDEYRETVESFSSSDQEAQESDTTKVT